MKGVVRMSKAILVIDMPDSCDKCPVFGSHYSDMCCRGLNSRGINYPYPKDFRQEWCPLKKFPDKKELSPTSWLKSSRATGWNECLDEILKGCDKNG